jgi:hypothetical protein
VKTRERNKPRKEFQEEKKERERPEVGYCKVLYFAAVGASIIN